MRISLCGLGGLALVLVSGCAEDSFIDPLPDVIQVNHGIDGSELVTFRTVHPNDVQGNGFRWNGFRWNGFRWNGFRWNGFRWNGFRWNGVELSNIQWDSSNGSLQGDDDQSNTQTLDPTDEVIADGDFDDGQTTDDIETRISEIEQFHSSTYSFQFQRVQTRTLPDGEWEDACEDGAGNPVKAVMLKGDWNSPEYDRVTSAGSDEATTWACRGAALAKCAEWGYHPEGTSGGTPLADHHQACTRMVRADYCGNGDHHTENGTLIDVGDSLGIQAHSTSWSIESAWGPDGALCINDPRKTYWTRDEASIGCALPTCDANGNDDLTDDAAHWYSQGALLITRNEPSALVNTPPAPSDSGG